MDKFRLVYIADAHGNELIIRKAVSACREYKADVLIIGGDLTGKVIVPIIDKGDRYEASYKGNKFVANSRDDLERVKTEIRYRAAYPVVLTEDEVQEIKEDPQKLDSLFKDVTIEETKHIVSVLDNIVDDIITIMTPGNDDIFEIDEVLKSSERIIYPLERVVELPLGYQMISMDYTTETPWNTPREVSDRKLWKKLEKEAKRVSVSWDKVICNFHEPPYGTTIDLAPKLDENLQPIYKLGELETEHVGSKSIYKFMEKYQPVLGLHGHIHESPGYDKIGRTMIFNPGSEYQYGELKAIILDLDRDGLSNWFRIG